MTIWNIDYQQSIVALSQHLCEEGAAFSPNGAFFVYGCSVKGGKRNRVALYNAKTWQFLLELPTNPSNIVRHISFSPCGTLVASVSDGYTLQICRIIDRPLIAAQALALLGSSVALYVCLDIIDMLAADSSGASLESIVGFLHLDKIRIVERVNKSLKSL